MWAWDRLTACNRRRWLQSPTPWPCPGSPAGPQPCVLCPTSNLARAPIPRPSPLGVRSMARQAARHNGTTAQRHNGTSIEPLLTPALPHTDPPSPTDARHPAAVTSTSACTIDDILLTVNSGTPQCSPTDSPSRITTTFAFRSLPSCRPAPSTPTTHRSRPSRYPSGCPSNFRPPTFLFSTILAATTTHAGRIAIISRILVTTP